MYVRKSDGAEVKFDMLGNGLIKVQFADEPPVTMLWPDFLKLVTIASDGAKHVKTDRWFR
ncbi:hypothetical protein A9308_00655 [Moraxella atlantae]|uniref:Uncharacterized protein n=1 Tax=Faucicola atlantae TaxID=34059 RepID=A0A1B8Q900_9GAMM|nr:hypothetical protein A9308_00655 [Moraxella atlantae]